jgi:hypothetical protein
MTYFVIGDAHRTGGDARDIFSCRPGSGLALRELADHAHAQGGHVINVGDHGDYWLGHKGRVDGCLDGEDGLWLPGDIKIAGNHDPADGVAEVVLEVGGRKILVTHGARFDKYNCGVRRWIGWSSTRIAGRVMDLNGSPITTTGETVVEYLHRLIGHTLDLDAFEAAAEKYRILMGADVIVCGHTHVAKVTPTYANPGAWLQRGYLQIDDDGTITLNQWE